MAVEPAYGAVTALRPSSLTVRKAMHDFDFFAGTWDIVNRWRTDFLDSSSEWEEFPGISHASRHFDGNASCDEIIFPTKGFSGLTLRLYNPDTGQWSLYWASKRTGTLFPPVAGEFKQAAARSSARTPTTTCPFSPGSGGPASPTRPRTGSRPFPSTAARPGSTTGTWTRPGG